METQKIEMKLFAIQQALVAPKDQYNNFGNYAYRTCEGILEAVKPFLKAHNLTILMSDDLINMGTRFYVKATATLCDADTGEQIAVSAFAREEENKKGMDQSQITGASSSYARKYALCGLLAIDGNKDSDETNTQEQNPPQQGKQAPRQQAPRQQASKQGNTGQMQPITYYQRQMTQLYLSQNEKALQYYLNAAKVQDITQLDITAVYHHLKDNNKINC